MRIGRHDISLVIHSKLNGVIPKKYILDAVNIICDSIREDLIDGKPVSVHNLGTWSPYMFHGHQGLNVATGKVEEHQPFKSVKFRPHSTLTGMLKDRRQRFLK